MFIYNPPYLSAPRAPLTETLTNTMKNILVTGGNAGIGLALCRQLLVEQGCFVFMGARSLERGAAGVKSIIDKHPDVASRIELLEIDVSSDDSVAAAVATFKEKGKTLYALVNNAGVGLNRYMRHIHRAKI